MRPHDTRTDGLITTPNDQDSTRASRRLAGVVVFTFLAILVGTAAVDRLAPVEKPKLVGEESLEDRRLRASAKLVDGSAARLLERDLRLTSRVRRAISEPWALALYRSLREAGENVLVGPGDWLFMRSRAEAPPGPPADVVALPSAMVAAVARRAASFGIEFVAVPLPRKAVVCRDRLPAGFDPRPQVDAAMIAALRARGVTTVDLLTPFREMPPEELYLPTDGHWVERAQVVAAEHICREAGLLVPAAERAGEVKVTGEGHVALNTFYQFGVDPESDALYFLEHPPSPQWSVVDGQGRIVRARGSREIQEIALAGTSFSARRKLPALVAHFARAAVYNGAEPGAYPLVRAVAIFALRTPELPHTLLVEMPMHGLFEERHVWSSGNGLAESPPEAVVVLAGPESLGVAPRLLERPIKLAEERRMLLNVEARDIAHTGDGVLEVRLRGEVVRGSALIEVSTPGSPRLIAKWPKGATEVVLPIVNAKANSAGFGLEIAGRANVDLQSVELVTAADETRGGGGLGAGTVGEVRVAEADASQAVAEDASARSSLRPRSEWTVTLHPGSRGALPPQSTLIVQLGELAPRTSVRVEVETEAGRRLELRPLPVRTGALLVVNLAPLAGERVEGVRLGAAGAAPKRPVEALRIVAPRASRRGE